MAESKIGPARRCCAERGKTNHKGCTCNRIGRLPAVVKVPATGGRRHAR
jgi:hypothetical protein